ncbi:hypothetical protein EDF70_11270 [Neorhizobium sp. JUb45]|nr:hypothetical protein EDF70_11270 [Neorhizobium sp. JUb45]
MHEGSELIEADLFLHSAAHVGNDALDLPLGEPATPCRRIVKCREARMTAHKLGAEEVKSLFDEQARTGPRGHRFVAEHRDQVDDRRVFEGYTMQQVEVAAIRQFLDSGEQALVGQIDVADIRGAFNIPAALLRLSITVAILILGERVGRQLDALVSNMTMR